MCARDFVLESIVKFDLARQHRGDKATERQRLAGKEKEKKLLFNRIIELQ